MITDRLLLFGRTVRWLRNGECVAFHLGDRYVQGRMEYDEGWHLSLGDVQFVLWPKGIYAVRIEK